MPYANSNGVRIHYDEHSQSGEALIFVHGYMGAGEDWRQQIAEFSKNYRVVTFDHRGHGSSDTLANESEYGVDQLVQDTLCVIAAIGVSRYHLVGHSIGGGVVQEIAYQKPGNLLSLVLCDTTDWFGDHDQPGGTPPYTPLETSLIGVRRAKSMTQQTLRGTWQGLLNWHGSSTYASQIQTKTLILVGQGDASRIVEGSNRLLESIKSSSLRFIPQSGHSPHRENPTIFNQELLKFLRSLN